MQHPGTTMARIALYRPDVHGFDLLKLLLGSECTVIVCPVNQLISRIGSAIHDQPASYGYSRSLRQL